MTPGARRDVPFRVVATSQISSYEGDATVIVGSSDSARARITQLVAGAAAPNDRVLVAAFQGAQRTGGFAIRIDSVERDGDTLLVHASFTEVAPGAVVTQVLTSPSQAVSISAVDASGARMAILLDAQGTERARANAG